MINTESGAGLIEAFTRGSEEKTPVLSYFYEPQNLRLVMAPYPRGNHSSPLGGMDDLAHSRGWLKLAG